MLDSMLRSLLVVVMVAVALPVVSPCPPMCAGGSLSVMASPAAPPAAPQTSTVLDPVGDTLSRRSGIPRHRFCPDYEDGKWKLRVAHGNGRSRTSRPTHAPHLEIMKYGGSGPSTWIPLQVPGVIRSAPGNALGFDFVVYVSWNGTAFTGAAIDRRPLITGGEAIITAVPFSINGTMVEAALASTLIGDVPPHFGGFHSHRGLVKSSWARRVLISRMAPTSTSDARLPEAQAGGGGTAGPSGPAFPPVASRGFPHRGHRDLRNPLRSVQCGAHGNECAFGELSRGR